LTYNAKFCYGTTYVATGASNGQLRLYNTFSFNVSAETPALKTWSRATGLDWTNDNSKDIIYQGYEDGVIRQWNFDRKTKKFKMEYDDWSHLEAIRDIITIPKYDLMISTCRVIPTHSTLSYISRTEARKSGTPKTTISTTS